MRDRGPASFVRADILRYTPCETTPAHPLAVALILPGLQRPCTSLPAPNCRPGPAHATHGTPAKSGHWSQLRDFRGGSWWGGGPVLAGRTGEEKQLRLAGQRARGARCTPPCRARFRSATWRDLLRGPAVPPAATRSTAGSLWCSPAVSGSVAARRLAKLTPHPKILTEYSCTHRWAQGQDESFRSYSPTPSVRSTLGATQDLRRSSGGVEHPTIAHINAVLTSSPPVAGYNYSPTAVSHYSPPGLLAGFAAPAAPQPPVPAPIHELYGRTLL